jgi:hypothetical protein
MEVFIFNLSEGPHLYDEHERRYKVWCRYSSGHGAFIYIDDSTLFDFLTELHPLLNNRAKDKQQSGGKKTAGRPRTDERKRTK